MDDSMLFLPQMLSGEELDERLRVLPPYEEAIRRGSVTERLIALQHIYQVYVPNQIGREVYAKIYLALLRSLQKKQSLLAIKQSNENNRIVRQQTYDSIIGGADSFTIIGTSGIGKSSAVSRAVRIITDDAYIEMNNSKVIPCLTVQAPADGSIKGLLLEILRKVDEVLDTRYQMNAIRSKATVDILIGSVSQVSLNHIGILIVDEIQNVAQSKNGKMIVGTLIQLINNSGVSICMVGTPEAAVFFDRAMMLARRSLGLRYELIEYGDAYCDFCRTLLAYNYTKTDVEVNEGLLNWLYNHSNGNISVTVNLIHDAQEVAILEGHEKLDITTLTLAFEKRLTMLHDYITPEVQKAEPVKKKAVKVNPNADADNSSSKRSAGMAESVNNSIDNGGRQIGLSEIIAEARIHQEDAIWKLTSMGIRVEEVVL